MDNRPWTIDQWILCNIPIYHASGVVPFQSHGLGRSSSPTRGHWINMAQRGERGYGPVCIPTADPWEREKEFVHR